MNFFCVVFPSLSQFGHSFLTFYIDCFPLIAVDEQFLKLCHNLSSLSILMLGLFTYDPV